MYTVVKSEQLTENIYLMEVKAKRVAKSCQPGQFLIVRVDEDGERIPLTICDYNREKETVTIVFQIVGGATLKMCSLKIGEKFADIVGPLGNPSELTNDPDIANKKILFVAGGVGTAPIYPQVKWLHDRGIEADVIIGTKTKETLILEDKMKEVAANLYVTTDDGSYGRSGLVTKVIEELIEKEGKKYDICVAIGPMIMMKFCCLTTKKYDLHTIVSLNPIMVDGTGMCGACRVTIGGEVKFACVDGPEFDGHKVDFDQAMKRQQLYKSVEGRSYLQQTEGDTHRRKDGCGGRK